MLNEFIKGGAGVFFEHCREVVWMQIELLGSGLQVTGFIVVFNSAEYRHHISSFIMRSRVIGRHVQGVDEF